MVKRIRGGVIAGLLGLALLAFAYQEEYISQRDKSIFEYPESVLQIYSALSQEGLNSDGVAYLAMQDNGEDFVNYWIQGCKCISLLCSYHTEQSNARYLTQAAEIMEKFMDTWERYRKFPRPAYAEFDYGWVSSMDAPTIMVASHMLYELTGEEKYRLFIDDLIEYVVKDVSCEGFNVVIKPGEIWPLEYAALISDADNAKFVLNGSLVGYLGCRIISDFYRSGNLDKYIGAVERCYRNRLAQYRFEKYEWSRYMMNPETVIPPHYMIFEMKLFDAAYELTGRKFYKLEKEFRQSAIRNVLHLEFVETNDKNVRGGYQAKYSMLCTGLVHRIRT